MKKTAKFLCLIITVSLLITSFSPSVFAKTFASTVNTDNLGVNTQYLYDENDPSWLRKLVVKEDMLAAESFVTELLLYPVCDYPYTTDAPTFKKTVAENIELYTLDDDSQKAAYLYFFQQLGALTVISEPDTDYATMADWLRAHGIIVTAEDEADPDKAFMISALYALMRNDLYYVYTGQHFTIPEGTPLEEALVMYTAALSGQNSTLYEFVSKYFGISSIPSLDDYIYYTSLFSLYSQGYVSAKELTTISENEVYRRVAIMTIRTYGIAVDSETATTEEIRLKYLTAMLGSQYSVTLDPSSVEKALNKGTVAFYILQRMAYEDAKLTLSSTKYSYEQCFDLVLKKTDRFDLEQEFYSDIYEYNTYLEYARSSIYINPTPISNSGVTVYINGKEYTAGEYANVPLNGTQKQTLNIVCRYVASGKTKTSTYKLNVYQGSKTAPGSDLTGIISTLGSIITTGVDAIIPAGGSVITGADYGNMVMGTNNELYSLNSAGQIVDRNGTVYETLPEGYVYTVDEDGNIQLVLADSYLTEPTTADSNADSNTGNENLKKTAVIVSVICLIALAIGIVIAVKLKKGKHGKVKDKNNRKRKNKEKS